MFKIDIKDWNKLQGYAQMAYNGVEGNNISQCEIAGILTAITNGEDIVLINPVILKQVVSGGNCTLDKEALAAYYTQVAIEYGPNNIKFVWWHSHHTMGAFWSGTDLAAIEEFNKSDFSMSLVINLKEEYKFRINWWKPTKSYIDTELTIVHKSAITEEMITEFKQLVKPERITPKLDAVSVYNTEKSGWKTKFKQPGNYGPGYVDRTLMDNSDLIYDKYLDIVDDYLEETIFVGSFNITFKDFKKDWKNIQQSAKKDGVNILDIKKPEFEKIHEEQYALAGDYVRTQDGYGHQPGLWRHEHKIPGLM